MHLKRWTKKNYHASIVVSTGFYLNGLFTSKVYYKKHERIWVESIEYYRIIGFHRFLVYNLDQTLGDNEGYASNRNSFSNSVS